MEEKDHSKEHSAESSNELRVPGSGNDGVPKGFSFHHDVRRSYSFTSVSPQPPKRSTAANATPLNLKHGTASIQGARKTQEDAHTSVPELERPPKEKGRSAELPFAFFGIYDGHGGDKASEYICQTLHVRFAEEIHKIDQEDPAIDQLSGALKNAILKVEEDWMADCAKTKDCSGSTLAVVVIKDNNMLVANVGDSEIVICGEEGKAITLTEIHNPKRNPAEGERVKAAGGNLYRDRVAHPVLNPMVMSIAVSRAIGDYGFKAGEFTSNKPSGLVADPYLNSLTLRRNKHHFCIIACDGLWDVSTPQEAVDFVQARLKEGKSVDDVAKALVDNAYENGSLDNISASIVLFDWSDDMDTSAAEDDIEDVDHHHAAAEAESGSKKSDSEETSKDTKPEAGLQQEASTSGQQSN
eukprot:TRINITY_DN2651_c0_g1_i1.p1 TRINITY_DN2651_c0_g1~~TRINITY_DN2651_c0_g1_i1.p1  ORF type:complete len:411 (+),score=83.96 TRINITY_DN2651_c0_g1_i1:81-1313(+)